MKKSRNLLYILFLGFLFSLCFYLFNTLVHQERLPLIAHAGGGINGDTYTNSLEALNANRQRGYTFFEIDLSLTSDNIPVCIHDWKGSYKRSFGTSPPPKIPTLQKFIELKNFSSKYNKCTGFELIEWLKSHPKVILVTDNKGNNIEILRFIKEHFPEFETRVIPQIYQPEEYKIVRDMGYKKIIWTLYRYRRTNKEVLLKAKEMSLYAITMPKFRVNAGLALELDQLFIPTYVHTINDVSLAKSYFSLGIDGLYTDFITEDALKESD